MEGAKGIIKGLHRCARAGNARDAEAYLETMHILYCRGHTDLKPDTRHFNSVINAWVKSQEIGREFRAQEILDWMFHINKITDENYNVKPTCTSFNICINVWRESKERNAGDCALKLFHHMLSLYEAGDYGLKPNVQSFRLVHDSMIYCLSKFYPDNYIFSHLYVF